MVQLGGDLQIAECSFDDCAEWVGVLGPQLDETDLISCVGMAISTGKAAS